MNIYDIVIVGGGMVGASLAVALKNSGWKIALIEAQPLSASQRPHYDDRSVAISYGSSLILQRLGLWQNLAEYSTPINKIHISDRGHFGITCLDAHHEKVDALGYVLENRRLGQQLYQALETASNIDLFMSATVDNIEDNSNHLTLQLRFGTERHPRKIGCRLLVAADGGHSKVRDLRHIQTSVKDYQQSAIISNVTTSQSHQGIAYERFTDQGPLALLPLSKNRCSLVWTHRQPSVKKTLELTDKEFLQTLQKRFGWRLGRFIKTGQRIAYPLSLLLAKKPTATRTIIIGNAAHTLHPVAGQGYNLAIRDVALLQQLLQQAQQQQLDPAEPNLLRYYQQYRSVDVKQTVRFTDNLVQIFSNHWFPLTHLRASALFLLDQLPPLRHYLARQSMGLQKRQQPIIRQSWLEKNRYET